MDEIPFLNFLKITNNYERFPSKQIMTMPK